MSRFCGFEIIDPYSSHLLLRETSSICCPKPLAFPPFFEEGDPFDVFNASPFDIFESVTDLIRIEKTPSSLLCKRIQERRRPELQLQKLCDRVSKLESKFDRLVKAKSGGSRKHTGTEEIKAPVQRKYKWEVEIKNPVERKYTWTTELIEEKKKKKKKKHQQKHHHQHHHQREEEEEEEDVVVVKKPTAGRKNCKWTAEVKTEKENGGISRTYTFKSSSGDAGKCGKPEKEHKKKEKSGERRTRVVEIEEDEEEEEEEHEDRRAAVLRHAFAKRAGAVRNYRGKNNDLSPQDAAVLIQITFRAYLIRRSKALRALRELAIAKTKLKEIRAQFNNFTYRRRVAQNPAERQTFSEKIIVLLLTVDSVEGVDLMVRSAKRSMVDELEAMLDVIDPQPLGKSLSMRRRTFDMPDTLIRKDIADGVTQIVQMLEDEKIEDGEF